jgi:catechol 2,3-dioxygenase-like lactoylglutathione lyase family enzyme
MASLPLAKPAVTFHLSLNVLDLGRSVAFYRVLFGRAPAKQHDDYAKFELEDPPVVFSLAPRASLGQGKERVGGSLSHLGFRVASPTEVRLAQERLAVAGLCTQDQNGTVCGYARQDKVWVRDPDGNFWEIYSVDEEVEPALVRRSLDGPAPPSAPAAGPVVWEHFITQPVNGPVGHAGGSVDEVRLTGTFNAALEQEELAGVLAEAFRVLKPGGKVVTHGLMGDRPLPGGQPKLPGLAAMVSHVPARDEVMAALRAAGFVHLQAVKLTEKPWFVHDGVGLREVKLLAMKPMADDGPTRQVLYKGPFAEARADGGHTFPRGVRVGVTAAVWQELRQSTCAGQFLFFEPNAGACDAG